MTTFWTGTQIQTKVENDLDLVEETFITPTEMLGYINAAIDDCEAEIMGAYPDYFLSRASLALVTGTEEYVLPTDIYAHKIRRVVYRNGTTVYPIQRMKDWHKFEEYSAEYSIQSSTYYQYFVMNQTSGSPKLLLAPPAKETSASNVTIWYTRNAKRLSAITETCDIPEFINFLLSFVKVQCYLKEGHPNYQMEVQMLEQQRALMQATLSEMVPDADDEIEPDLRIYSEMS